MPRWGAGWPGRGNLVSLWGRCRMATVGSVSDEWVIWQWIDSAFPAGALAHSAGLEAAWQAGEVPDAAHLREYLAVSLRQAARLAVPFVTATCRQPEAFDRLDREYDLLLSNHIANRASRAQGQAMLATAAKIFGSDRLSAARSTARAQGSPMHLPPVVGLVAASIGLSPQRAAGVFLFTTLRTGISAAVRLGIVGPLEGQAIQRELTGLGENLAANAWQIEPGQAVQLAPVSEILQATSDRLYSRLFVS